MNIWYLGEMYLHSLNTVKHTVNQLRHVSFLTSVSVVPLAIAIELEMTSQHACVTGLCAASLNLSCEPKLEIQTLTSSP